jgi:hypothetical protein
MADVDYPTDGEVTEEDLWGGLLVVFTERTHIMDGINGGLIVNVINQGQFVTNQEQPLYNVPGV